MTATLLQPIVRASAALVWRMTRATGHAAALPMLIFYPTSRCNSRCVSCDWWRSDGGSDLTLAEIEQVAAALPGLGTRLVALSGGEPLLRPDVFEIARLFSARQLALHLLTSGLGLARHAEEVGRLFARVTVSLDAAQADDYARIRGVDALRALETGVTRLRAVAPAVPVTARCTLHALNYRALPAIIRKARGMGCASISFLAADTTSDAFGRGAHPVATQLRLDARQTAEFRCIVERTLREDEEAFTSGFVTTRPAKLRQLPTYYAALNDAAPFPPQACNAPWVSAVLEADGDVRPCFFHPAVGNIRHRPLERIIAEDLAAFCRQLDVGRDATCRRCVCSLKAGRRHAPWR